MEHFMREIGQLYEAACSLPDNAESRQQFQHLPSVVADLLLDGFPLELVDGDASNIPVRWVTDVLTELHRKVQPKSRLLVVTVLGVQSTGKSTLLNTMFGVQFAVSSGRCTRGAFMLLIRVKEDLKQELNCDFILLIDTEGLKSPELAQLEDSYEHDNELATLVVGLSDITIVNIAMENSTEMKDILQIVVHAFLRMKIVGKKPKCQFVHQNVGGVSAHNKNMTERKHLLKHLNEMTEIAAKMEKQQSVSKFTDVMEYDAENSNWYIPGLWHGIPPMAPVNTGYSEAVYEFKKSLFEVLKHCKDDQPPAHITEFLEWMESLWKSVKYENFIFSFRNTLVADAYNDLCIAFSKWEWSFRKHMFSWAAEAEVRISNFKSNQPTNLADLLRCLRSEATQELASEEKKISDQLAEYYKKKERHVRLVEKYREDFRNSIKSLTKETDNAIRNTLDKAMAIKKGMTKLKDIHETDTAAIERKVLDVLKDCRERGVDLSDTQLDEEFENMWRETIYELNIKAMDKKDVASNVFKQLRTNLERQGSAVQEQLNNVKDFTKCGVTAFEVHDKNHFQKCSFFKRVLNVFKNTIKQTEEMANNLIGQCKDYVSKQKERKTDYHDIYTRELLVMIDETLEETNNKKLKTNPAFEVELKLHICGFAAKGFQQMHEQFLMENNPEHQLEKFKTQYKSTFVDLYHKKDQRQKKAKEFVNLCLTPAVREYVHRTLGIEIVDAILTGGESVKYSSRSFFQFTILKQLLTEGNVSSYVRYTNSYKYFVKECILDRIICHFTKDASIGDLEIKCLDVITTKIEQAVKTAQTGKDNAALPNDSKGTSIFIENICSILSKDIVIPQDTLGGITFQITAKYEEFVTDLQTFLKEMNKLLRAEFSKGCKIEEKLKNLPFKPQDELFKRVFGCGEQCPFCKVPCEAGGKEHREHHASVHRPQGLGMCSYEGSEKLVETICTTDVYSENKFKNIDIEGKAHPYKDYRRFYPDWNIAPDASIEASDYWKYILTTFNEQFAKEFNAQPADIPKQWKSITKKQALKSLQELFNVK
ncbi:Interferon-induced very large GTPase 1 [Acipenser ruthenus]|uniref:Interferon-induced very large GTPase 1 n=1 Tax=Acipenser ruthenus TaxID=7906 RepID=A0A444V007_ACIRT|nr:Interferon-induced very large GTPase 1 [Acipenser ruthenus]